MSKRIIDLYSAYTSLMVSTDLQKLPVVILSLPLFPSYWQASLQRQGEMQSLHKVSCTSCILGGQSDMKPVSSCQSIFYLLPLIDCCRRTFVKWSPARLWMLLLLFIFPYPLSPFPDMFLLSLKTLYFLWHRSLKPLSSVCCMPKTFSIIPSIQ